MTTLLKTDPDIYPYYCDGKPMSDNTEQYRWIVIIKENLELLFADVEADVEDVFIAGDLFWLPVEMEGWVSPRLGIRFLMTTEDLEIYRPDGQKFLTTLELEQERQQAEQRAGQAEQERDRERLLRQQEQQLREQTESKLKQLTASLSNLAPDQLRATGH